MQHAPSSHSHPQPIFMTDFRDTQSGCSGTEPPSPSFYGHPHPPFGYQKALGNIVESSLLTGFSITKGERTDKREGVDSRSQTLTVFYLLFAIRFERSDFLLSLHSLRVIELSPLSSFRVHVAAFANFLSLLVPWGILKLDILCIFHTYLSAACFS